MRFPWRPQRCHQVPVRNEDFAKQVEKAVGGKVDPSPPFPRAQHRDARACVSLDNSSQDHFREKSWLWRVGCV